MFIILLARKKSPFGFGFFFFFGGPYVHGVSLFSFYNIQSLLIAVLHRAGLRRFPHWILSQLSSAQQHYLSSRLWTSSFLWLRARSLRTVLFYSADRNTPHPLHIFDALFKHGKKVLICIYPLSRGEASSAGHDTHQQQPKLCEEELKEVKSKKTIIFVHALLCPTRIKGAKR